HADDLAGLYRLQRTHRQGLHQSARRSLAPRRAGGPALCRSSRRGCDCAAMSFFRQPINVVRANAGTHTPRTIDVRLELSPDQTQTLVFMGPRLPGCVKKRVSIAGKRILIRGHDGARYWTIAIP